MADIDLDKCLLREKIPATFKKIKGILTLGTITADNLKIEIPLNINSATYNKDNKVNKLVTVFAGVFCTLDNNCLGDKPGFSPLLLANTVTGDNNRRASSFVPRYCATASSRSLQPGITRGSLELLYRDHSQPLIKLTAWQQKHAPCFLLTASEAL